MIIFSKEQFNEIREHCIKVLPNEACGLLAGTIDNSNNKIIQKVYLLRNIDESPEHFSMDIKEQFKVISDIRKNEWSLIGNFHSHPETPSRPSEEDIRLAFDPNLSYAILSFADKEEIIFNSFIIKDNIVSNEKLIVMGG
ncbi:M67 family metallopeptidase [Clostridium beijerinckii]|uniref:M67 family metallopeptidase n=1 Tax=Clostridium beijerinckii TaxID=1520 RepID=UPI001570E38D|nr:M67 family metallopeptidase [Clostridium beijerinckii]NRT71460.1 proteasome lid subunit RPN8/RPN11 [Clostridium beijerinckii]